MEVKNATNGSSKIRQGSQGSQPQGEPPSMGYVSGLSSEYGTNEIGISREDSNQSNNSIAPGEQSSEGIAGKIVSQLIHESEKQLAYHEQQAQFIRERIEELKHFSEEMNET